MNKLPEYFLDALLDYNITVTLVTGKELLVFKGVRCHQSFHIGFTRKTIYIPEGVIREAINKGWDSWAISEAVQGQIRDRAYEYFTAREFEHGHRPSGEGQRH